jgi:hypothetical protein
MQVAAIRRAFSPPSRNFTADFGGVTNSFTVDAAASSSGAFIPYQARSFVLQATTSPSIFRFKADHPAMPVGGMSTNSFYTS